ncbi:MAG: oligosaccharide flippase family protein, partial [Patescibacteria group bacterium]|nr:oligosaccharide flippase family protein [Patescibacteria group bacterium]
MSVLQILANSIVLFVLYRFIIRSIGVEQFGIWSLILAITSVSRLGDLGFSNSVVKFVAKYVARGEDRMVSGVIQTAAILIGLVIGILLVITYIFSRWFLVFIVPKSQLFLASAILPYAFFSFWIISIASVFYSSLDGYQRIDIRSRILISATILNLFVCFLLVPAYGLMGLAYAQVIQSVGILIISWSLIKRYIKLLPIIPYEWNKNLFFEMLGYGINFQVASISGMLCDPVTKVFLSRFGGLATVGYYEMASRLVIQFRSFIISANQVIVPAIADLQERSNESVQIIYKNSYRLLFYISIPIFSLIIILSPQ